MFSTLLRWRNHITVLASGPQLFMHFIFICTIFLYLLISWSHKNFTPPYLDYRIMKLSDKTRNTISVHIGVDQHRNYSVNPISGKMRTGNDIQITKEENMFLWFWPIIFLNLSIPFVKCVHLICTMFRCISFIIVVMTKITLITL